VATARDDFLTSGSVPAGTVREPILTSWRRSQDAGVDADLSHVPFEEVDVRSPLVRCAEPVMDRLHEGLDDMPVSVVLTDASGRLLERRESDARLRRRLDAVVFAPGFSYGETHVGTNGVGTALEEGRAAYVYGPEHFNEHIQGFACAGVPIRNPLTGRIEGVFDISCLADDANPMMRVLAQEAARDIERLLLEQGSARQRAMLDAFLTACRGGRSAVVAISGELVMTDPRAASLLTPADQVILRGKAAEVAGPAPAMLELCLSEGRLAQARCAPVSVAGDTVGTVIKLTVRHQESRTSKRRPAPVVTLPEAVGRSPVWLSACQEVRAAADQRRSLLLVGEPGTGKFALARGAHHERFPTGGLLVVDCGDDPARLVDHLDEELEAGAATVVFRHLELLGPSSVEPVRQLLHRLARRPSPAWVVGTVDAATGPGPRGCDGLLGHFAASVTVPALRHRIEDLDQLVPWLLDRLAPWRTVRCTPDAMRALLGFVWPGNVAQLQLVLRDALTRRPAGDIRSEDLPAECFTSCQRVLMPMEALERDAIIAALRRAGGNRLQAAADLGIARSSLYRKIHSYGIGEVHLPPPRH
jgi:transcriptional regulator of acetoin/glycerol metabolism